MQQSPVYGYAPSATPYTDYYATQNQQMMKDDSSAFWWIFGFIIIALIIGGIIWLILATTYVDKYTLSGTRSSSSSSEVNSMAVQLQMTSSLGADEKLSVVGGQSFTFSHKFKQGETYDVIIVGGVVTGACTVVNGSGIFNTSDITNLLVTCVPDPTDPEYSCYSQLGTSLDATLYFEYDGADAAYVRIYDSNDDTSTVALTGASGAFAAVATFLVGNNTCRFEMLNSASFAISDVSDEYVIFISDETPPTVSSLTSPASNQISIEGTFGTDADVKIELNLDGNFCDPLTQTGVTTAGGAYSFTVTGVGGGTRQVYVRAYPQLNEPTGWFDAGSVDVLI